MKKRIPDFLIVGAPKCGTTTLYKWLSQHPAIFMPEEKEPRFFTGYKKNFRGPISSMFNSFLVQSPEEYSSLFADADDNALTGEASADYLSSRSTPARIKEYNSDARIIILLRNPAERAYSEYLHNVRDGYESKTFLQSIELEESRRSANCIPGFFHIMRGTYYENVKEYIDLFGMGNVFVRLYDDLVSNQELLLDETLTFLGVHDFAIDTTKSHNVGGIPKSRLLQRLINNQGPWRAFTRKIVGKRIFQKTGSVLKSLNLDKAPKLGGPVRVELINRYFRDDIIKLQGLIGRDLSSWLC